MIDLTYSTVYEVHESLFGRYIIDVHPVSEGLFSCCGESSVGQNKLLQLILGYIYILKHLQSNFIGKILFFGNS